MQAATGAKCITVSMRYLASHASKLLCSASLQPGLLDTVW
jgi:hypothetical protein